MLFIEKEGFGPLFAAERLAERYDLAIMSTKGMSVTAARMLLDKLCYRSLKLILVLHDFDVSGFSIFGTLGTTNRRYCFANNVPVIDIGLRLADVELIGLESEPTDVSGNWWEREQTLRRHGATPEEIAFLKSDRVELNAMTSRQLLDFVEQKLGEHGVEKLVPQDAIIESHARRLIEQRLAGAAIARLRSDITKRTAAAKLPGNLRGRLAEVFEKRPELPWDAALAEVLVKKSAGVGYDSGRQLRLPLGGAEA